MGLVVKQKNARQSSLKKTVNRRQMPNAARRRFHIHPAEAVAEAPAHGTRNTRKRHSFKQRRNLRGEPRIDQGFADKDLSEYLRSSAPSAVLDSPALPTTPCPPSHPWPARESVRPSPFRSPLALRFRQIGLIRFDSPGFTRIHPVSGLRSQKIRSDSPGFIPFFASLALPRLRDGHPSFTLRFPQNRSDYPDSLGFAPLLPPSPVSDFRSPISEALV
jgi:hypothetical protein